MGGLLAVLIIVICKLLDPTMTVGWASIICAIIIFAGLILMVLGIIGEYLGKMILIMNKTPQFIVRETINVGVSVISVLLVVFMSLLECLVCFIQAYVFMTLSALFIGMAQVEEHE